MTTRKQNLLAHIPPVNDVLAQPPIQALSEQYSRDLVVTLVQEAIAAYRQACLQGRVAGEPTRQKITSQLVERVTSELHALLQPSLRPVINATGVILHTGLGRAPLPAAARENLQAVARGYCSLELDLETGKRGDRGKHVERLLCLLTGAEAACVVNNNAAAVLLTLNTLSFGKEAVVSRGQLIEIGGAFRIPEVMEKSGARMVEVGTTNKTHLRDYERALSENTGVICVVHPSNYRVLGFTAEVALEELVELAHQHDVPLFQDLGGGVLFDFREHGLPYEPVAGESIRAGVDVVTFSGDKVLGGPQCGIIVGKRRYVDEIKRNPLMRAVRCDKLIYAALEPTLKLYLKPDRLFQDNVVLQLLTTPLASLETRARKLLDQIPPKVRNTCAVEVVDSRVQIGSGALPLEELPSRALSLKPNQDRTERLAQRFRRHEPPVVGYVRDDRLFLDLRTVLPEEDEVLLQAIQTILR